ncbi:Rho GTPase activation protein [Lactarius sanguifluus]|nr:Rho GTPase activation protein [Lactarius sanguifluus]
MDGMTSVLLSLCEIFEDSAEVDKGLARPETYSLRASFRRAHSLSIPPCTLYRNYHPGAHSDSIFGVPLVDVTCRDSVPKVIRMCIEEVEKRGLNTKKIYSLRRRFDNEKTFSFKSTDNIHSVAMLLWLYLLDLPEPLFMLSLRDYRQYAQNRARYTENDFSLLRSKIGELHPVHRASLGTLLRHLLRVSSHSDKNAMTVEALATRFSYTVLRTGNAVQGGVDVKKLVMEDLIQNAHALFDERPSPSPPPLVNSGVGCGVIHAGTGGRDEKVVQGTT